MSAGITLQCGKKKKKTCQTCSHISPTTVISAVNDPEIQQSSPSYRSTDARQNSKWLSGHDECRPKLGARRLHIGEGQRVGNWGEKKEAWAYTSLNANTSDLPDLKCWVSPVCWNGTPIVFHRFERKCVEGEKGLSAKMVGEKRTKTKLCRRDKTQEGSSSCRSSSSPSLGPSPVLLFLGKKKRERERGREQSVRAALISTWTTAGRWMLQDKTKKVLSMWQSVEWQQRGGGWGVVGQLRGWLLRHFSWRRGKQELSGLKTMIWAQRLVRCWTDSGVWQTVLLHKVLPEWGVEFKRGPEGPRVPATKWEKRWKSHRRGKMSPERVKDMWVVVVEMTSACRTCNGTGL